MCIQDTILRTKYPSLFLSDGHSRIDYILAYESVWIDSPEHDADLRDKLRQRCDRRIEFERNLRHAGLVLERVPVSYT